MTRLSWGREWRQTGTRDIKVAEVQAVSTGLCSSSVTKKRRHDTVEIFQMARVFNAVGYFTIYLRKETAGLFITRHQRQYHPQHTNSTKAWVIVWWTCQQQGRFSRTKDPITQNELLGRLISCKKSRVSNSTLQSHIRNSPGRQRWFGRRAEGNNWRLPSLTELGEVPQAVILVGKSNEG